MSSKKTKGKSGKARSPAADRGLSDQQVQFIENYLIKPNATQAAIKAGYSQKTAYSIGQKLLKHAEIKSRLDEHRKERARRFAVTADRVLEELTLIAYADLADVIRVNEDGDVQILPLDTVPADARRAVSEITQKVTESRTVYDMDETGCKMPRTVEKVQTSVKHHSKTAAIRMLMDYLGMDAPKNVKIESADGLRAMLTQLGKLMSPAAFKELVAAIAKAGAATVEGKS